MPTDRTERTISLSPQRRVRAIKNADFPAGYPWRWSAFLEDKQGLDWVELDSGDGDTAEDAIAEVNRSG